MEEFKEKPSKKLAEVLVEYQYAAAEQIFSELFDKKLVEVENRMSCGFNSQVEEEIRKRIELENLLKEVQGEQKLCQEKNQKLEEEKRQQAGTIEALQKEQELCQKKNQELEKEKEEQKKEIDTAGEKWCLLQEQKQRLEAEKQQKEEELKNLQVDLESCRNENQNLKTENRQKEEKLKDLQTDWESCREEQKKLESKNKQQEEAFLKLQEKWQRVEEQQKWYLLACIEQISSWAPFIDTKTYDTYVISICDEKNISLLYQCMKESYEAENKERVKLCDSLIDNCIEISYKAKNMVTFKRQEVESGQTYESALFDKVQGAKENGRIRKVIYRGLEKNGNLLGKSLVEVE